MIKKSMIISLILIGGMIVTGKTMAMLQEDEINRVNKAIRDYVGRERTIDDLVEKIERKSLWIQEHAKANGRDCQGGSLMCQGGPCIFSVEEDEVQNLQRDAILLLTEEKKYQSYILKLKDLRPRAIEEAIWINKHGPFILGDDGNCTSPLCNSQRQAYLPFMLTCLLSTHQAKAVDLRNEMLATLDKINSL